LDELVGLRSAEDMKEWSGMHFASTISICIPSSSNRSSKETYHNISKKTKNGKL